PGVNDTFIVTVNWGDGQTQSVARGAGAAGFGPLSHIYADNGAYTVSAQVTDKDGGVSNSLSQVVSVANVAPTLTTVALSSGAISDGSSVPPRRSSAVPGVNDTFTVSINWGDGQTDSVARAAGATGFGPLSHTYVDNGVYTV